MKDEKFGIDTTKLGWFVVRTEHNRHRFATKQEAEDFVSHVKRLRASAR